MLCIFLWLCHKKWYEVKLYKIVSKDPKKWKYDKMSHFYYSKCTKPSSFFLCHRADLNLKFRSFSFWENQVFADGLKINYNQVVAYFQTVKDFSLFVQNTECIVACNVCSKMRTASKKLRMIGQHSASTLATSSIRIHQGRKYVMTKWHEGPLSQSLTTFTPG